MPATHLRLVAIDGAQIAPAPRRRVRDAARRAEHEIMLLIIKEHLGHLTHSVSRIQALAKELEESLGISLPEFMPHPLPDLPRPDVSA
jgi:hypothetical protein